MAEQPLYTEAEARARETFLALMWALSYPGREQKLPEKGDSFHLIGESLLDLETSFYTPDATLFDVLARTGARNLGADRAAYHFYPSLTSLEPIEAASVGTMRYPDQAATLIIGCQFGRGTQFSLTGPGIKDTTMVAIDGVPEAFWSLRSRVNLYPLGWDVYLLDGSRILGLPRTTRMNRE